MAATALAPTFEDVTAYDVAPLAPVIELDGFRPARGAEPPARLTLTARGRLVVGVVAALVLIGLVLAAGPGSATAEPVVASSEYVVLEPGQTLWDIAATVAPEGSDPRVYLTDLLTLNGFATAEVPAWTVVLLPAG